MAIADDFSVENDGTGDIRYTGDGSTTYTVLAFKNYLGGLLDDQQASGDDLADIVTETIYERSTDEILTLNSPFNIDDTAAEHLYDGSITQNDGDDIYSGLYVVGVVVSGTEPMIVQDNKVLPSYWGEGLNPDTAENVIMKIMIKTRSGGADINSQKIRVMAREFNDRYAEFDVTLGTANATAAIFTSDDLNNDTAHASVEAWVGTIVNTEGFQELDVDGTGASGQEFYSKWDTGGQSLNEMYEFTKWIQKRSEVADENNAETGDDWVVDNATITGIGSEFSARDNDQILTEARFWLKIGAGTPTGNMYCELYDSDDASPAAPTGAVLATSGTLDVNRLTSTHVETIFRFTDGYSMTADQEYFMTIQHPDGDVSNYIEADGDTASADDGNYAHNTAGWTGVTGDALRFEVKSSPAIHGMAGELFRGITHEVVYDGESGTTVSEDSRLFWGTRVSYDGESGTFEVGRYVKIGASGTPTVAKNGGKILFDDTTGDVLYLALEDSSGTGSGQLLENDRITQIGGTAAYCDATATIVDDDKAGGEGVLLALDDNTGTGDLYLQVISGAAPVNDLRISEAAADYVLANVTINSKTVSPEFIGQSTGSNLIGAYGLGPDPDDVGASDTFFDLAGAQRTPPNNVTFTVSGLVSGEDRILVAPRTGSAMNKALYTLDGVHNSATQSTVTVDQAIQTETPPSSSAGEGNSTIRVQLDTGVYKYQQYTAWSGSVFTIAEADWSGSGAAADDNEVFPGYIDCLAGATTESFQAVHSSSRDIIIRVRDGGGTPIKTIESSAQFTGSAQTVTISRTSDA